MNAVPGIAVCTWSLAAGAGGLPRVLAAVGIDAVQLALSPLCPGPGAGSPRPAAVEELRAAGIELVSGMMAFAGEDYTSLESIARTGGVRPDEAWSGNLAHARAVAAVAAELGVSLVTFHAGFIPGRGDDPARAVLLERLGTIADLFAARGLQIAFETGQETAETLIAALDDLARPNVGVNFDPANMILYGTGDPVEALGALAPRIRQVHVKDAVPAEVPGTWGREVPAGAGAVDWEAFFRTARGFARPVNFVIEREAGADRAADVIAARALIERHLRGSGAGAPAARGVRSGDSE